MRVDAPAAVPRATAGSSRAAAPSARSNTAPTPTHAADPATAPTPAVEGARVAHLRIAVLSDAIPGRNGVGTYYDDLVQHLKDHVARVELFCPPKDRDAEGIHVRMPGDPTQSLHIPPLRKVWRRLSDLDPHIVLSGTPGVYGFLGMVKAMRLGVPFCFAHHTEYEKLADLYWEGRFGTLYRWTMTSWNSILLKRARVVLVHNETLIEAVRADGADAVELVGTPVSKLFLEKPLAPLEPELGHVSYIGRLAPEKELGQLFAAVEAHPDVRFRIVGEGPLREEVEAQARSHPNLEARGWVERHEVVDLLDDTGLLVLPSRYETFGTAALEALARRRPALVSSKCGIAHWPDLASGLFQMAPGEELTDALARVRALPADERLAVAERGRAAARELNSRTVSQILEVLSAAARPA
ncbi:MAG: glycosyltransferase [Gemmatimonadota bacterium]